MFFILQCKEVLSVVNGDKKVGLPFFILCEIFVSCMDFGYKRGTSGMHILHLRRTGSTVGTERSSSKVT